MNIKILRIIMKKINEDEDNNNDNNKDKYKEDNNKI